jgi:hypothetical protein
VFWAGVLLFLVGFGAAMHLISRSVKLDADRPLKDRSFGERRRLWKLARPGEPVKNPNDAEGVRVVTQWMHARAIAGIRRMPELIVAIVLMNLGRIFMDVGRDGPTPWLWLKVVFSIGVFIGVPWGLNLWIRHRARETARINGWDLTVGPHEG